MTASSVSFRIARHTEDLAQTIHALSQRLVRLDERLAALEVAPPSRTSLPPGRPAPLSWIRWPEPPLHILNPLVWDGRMGRK
jgi:hypothetical protein